MTLRLRTRPGSAHAHRYWKTPAHDPLENSYRNPFPGNPFQSEETMATLREHLEKFHAHAAFHHDELVTSYRRMETLGKSAKSDMKSEEQGGLCECLGKIAEDHEAVR